MPRDEEATQPIDIDELTREAPRSVVDDPSAEAPTSTFALEPPHLEPPRSRPPLLESSFEDASTLDAESLNTASYTAFARPAFLEAAPSDDATATSLELSHRSTALPKGVHDGMGDSGARHPGRDLAWASVGSSDDLEATQDGAPEVPWLRAERSSSSDVVTRCPTDIEGRSDAVADSGRSAQSGGPRSRLSPPEPPERETPRPSWPSRPPGTSNPRPSSAPSAPSDARSDDEGDEDEARLVRARSWDALLALYRVRLAECASQGERSAWLRKSAEVHERCLGDASAAFDLYVEALRCDPSSTDTVVQVERVASDLGRLGDLVELVTRSLASASPPDRLALLGHLVCWLEHKLGRAAEAKIFADDIERIDKSHPVSLQRAASVARASGDAKLERELLLRALERTSRPEERARLHFALANASTLPSEAQSHYEEILRADPSNFVALQALEALARAAERHAQVEWALERQINVAPTSADRMRALVELAHLEAERNLRFERAAQLFERALEIDSSATSVFVGLERCYRAMRAWSDLARVLRGRAARTVDAQARITLLERAAEVVEANVGDLEEASALRREILSLAPDHKDVLAELAKTAEKLGDFETVASCRERLAELASSPKQAATLFVQLGDMLSAQGRPSKAAARAYERATRADPSNVAAWEGLQRVAEQAGEPKLMLRCLEGRAANAPAPRQRAIAYVELAQVHAKNGRHEAARVAHEAAFSTDPSSEAAASALLEPWVAEERWEDALAACELLVAAAVRDRDIVAQYTRLRLATRIYAGLGEAERSITSALAALELRPDDASARADLVAVASECRERPDIVERARPWLRRISEGPLALPRDTLVLLVELHQAEGRLRDAVDVLEVARQRDPRDEVLRRKHAELLLGLGEFARACKLKVDLAREATSDRERFDALVEVAEIWAKQAVELEAAATVFEEARSLEPLDHRLLHGLLAIYSELGRWDALSGVLADITRIQESDDRRAKSLYAMAQVVRDKLGDSARAASLLDEILDIYPQRLEVFEELVRTVTKSKDWSALERFYRKMLARLRPDVSSELKATLFFQLGLIYRDRIGDEQSAFEAFEAAQRLRPDDASSRRVVTELLVVSGDLEAATSRLRAALERTPHDADLYAELYELFLRRRAFDQAWCAAGVLSTMRPLEDAQRTFLEDYPAVSLAKIPGQIVREAWASHLYHPDLDRTVTDLFAAVTPAVVRMRHAAAVGHASVPRPWTASESRLFELVRSTFANAAEILGMRPPPLLVGDSDNLMPFRPALAPLGAMYVSAPAVEQHATNLVYSTTKRLAEQRPDLAARAFFPSVSELAELIAAAIRISRRQRADSEKEHRLDLSLSGSLSRDESATVRDIVLRAELFGGVVDVRKWSRAADLSSMRAALLLSGDSAVARRAILAEPQAPSDLTPRDKLGELFKFAVSDVHAELRAALGIAIAVDT